MITENTEYTEGSYTATEPLSRLELFGPEQILKDWELHRISFQRAAIIPCPERADLFVDLRELAREIAAAEMARD